MKNFNTPSVIEKINSILDKNNSPFFAVIGKRSIKWFHRYEWLKKEQRGGYSVAIGEVKQWVSLKMKQDLTGLLEELL